MLQAYSNNEGIKVEPNTPIPFNSVAVQKGNSSVLTDVNTISLNRAGVYMISFDAILGNTIKEPTVSQLFVDNVPQLQAKTSATSEATTDKEAISFITLVQVNRNNSCSCCDKGVTLQVINTGDTAIYDHANIVVTKLC